MRRKWFEKPRMWPNWARPAEPRGREVAERLRPPVLRINPNRLRTGSCAIRKQNPQSLVAAVPVGAPKVCEDIEAITDELVVLEKPSMFYAVGTWYQDFEQTTDDEVIELLERNRRRRPAGE